MAVERVTCPLPVRKILVGSWVCWGGRGVGVGENIQGILMVKTVSGAWLKDTEKFPPSQKILSRGLVGKKKTTWKLLTQWKGTVGGGESLTEKINK